MSDPFRRERSEEVNKSLMTTRIIWLALLMGQLIFMAIVVLGILPHRHQPAQPRTMLTIANVLLLLTSVPVTFYIRKVVFARSRNADGGIPPAAYAAGNIIFWAGCEGVSFFGLIVAVITGTLSPTIIIVMIVMAFHVITFPTGNELSADSGK